MSFAVRIQILLILTSLSTLLAGISFEGYVGNYPIWVELDTLHGTISGEYFYRSRHIPIELRGKRHGDTLRFTEESDNTITGTWNCSFTGNCISEYRLEGIWSNGKTKLPLTLFRTNSDRYKDLKLNWKSSQSTSKFDSEIEYEEELQSSTLSFYYDSIVQYSESYCGIGAYETWWNEDHIYDLRSGSPIQMYNEIDPQQYEALCSYIQKNVQSQYDQYLEDILYEETRLLTGDSLLIEMSQETSDSLLVFNSNYESFIERVFDIDITHATLTSDEIGKLAKKMRVFQTSEFISPEGTELHFSLRTDGVRIYQPEGYFRFPRVNRAMEFFWSFTIPYTDMKRFLRSNSPLHRIK